MEDKHYPVKSSFKNEEDYDVIEFENGIKIIVMQFFEVTKYEKKVKADQRDSPKSSEEEAKRAERPSEESSEESSEEER